MYSVIPSFISADEGPGRHKPWPAAASNRRDGHELQRFPPALEKLMLLVRLDEQDDAGAEREFLPVQDCDAATLGHDELMVPFVRCIAENPPFVMMSSCIAVFRAPSS